MQREAHQNTLGRSERGKDGIQMTLHKAGASQQTAPRGGPGSFPTPVGGKGKRAEAPFKGGGDEEAVCMEENNKGKHGREEGEQWHSSPQFPGKLMRTALSFLYSGVGLQWAVGLGEGKRGSGTRVFFAVMLNLPHHKCPEWWKS